MSLSFINHTSGRISLVYAHFTSGCGSAAAAWMKEGWWTIQTADKVTVEIGFSGGAKYFFYAESDTGQTWVGEFSTSVPNEAFTQCWDISTPGSRQVSMRKIEVPLLDRDKIVDFII